MAENEPNTPAPAPTPDPASQGGNEPGPIPYNRFKEVNDQLAELRQWRQQQEAAQAEADKRRLEEQGNWKALAEQREKELNDERLAARRMKIAAAKGIPLDLADRLMGDDDDSLKKDADRLLAFIKPATGPGVPPPSNGGQGTSLDISKMSPAEIRANKGKLLPR